MTSGEDRIKKALAMIARFGGNDGADHKQWVLDQVVRILTDCPTETLRALDYRGTPYEYEGLGVSPDYREWLRATMDGEDGPETYSWDIGIAP